MLFLGLVVVLKGEPTLPWWSYLVALALGGTYIVSLSPMASLLIDMNAARIAFVAPFSNLLFARMGNGIATEQLSKS